MIAVVATSASAVAAALLPPTDAITRGAGRVYRFYCVDVGRGYSFKDLDGDVVVEVMSFHDEPTARQWVSADIAWRTARPLETLQ